MEYTGAEEWFPSFKKLGRKSKLATSFAYARSEKNTDLVALAIFNLCFMDRKELQDPPRRAQTIGFSPPRN
ncbi:unnamed protein product [Cochlearia groenlandica]